MIRVFIGFDERERMAFHVLSHSIWERASEPVSITPIRLDHLKDWKRVRDPLQSTDFSFTRFLVPYLCEYEGHAIFMDCDMLCLDDIAKLWRLRDDKPVKVVKHDYQPLRNTKFLNEPQTRYARKNWSSVILFNNAKCENLTLGYVSTAPGLDLHQFQWCEEIGELPENWNHLVKSVPVSQR